MNENEPYKPPYGLEIKPETNTAKHINTHSVKPL